VNRPPRLLTLLMALLALVGPPAASAQTFPKLSGYIVDEADLLPPADEAALDAKLAAFEARSKRQLVVATVSDLGGADIADYGVRLGRAWGIGSKDRNDGAIFLIAPNERRMRIEVGYGLEPVLTDAMAGRIIRDTVTPRFKDGDFVGGISAGTDAIITQIELPPEEARARAAAAEVDRGSAGAAIAFFVVFLLIIFVLVIVPLMLAGKRGKKYRRRSQPWGAPVIIWGGGSDWPRGSKGSGWGGGGFGGFGSGGFSGGGGSFGGGGASGGW
jgi:uncharacterized protein